MASLLRRSQPDQQEPPPTDMSVSAKSSRPRLTRIPAKGTALLLIDVINDLAFPGSESLIEEAQHMAPALAAFKRRAARAGVSIIYVNDNFGQWRSDFRQTVAHCTSK